MPQPVDIDSLSRIARIRRTIGGIGESVRQRAALLRGQAPDNAHTPSLKLLYGELGMVIEPVRILLRPSLPIEPAVEPKVVILMPGFATGPTRMRYMAKQLERAGHTVKRWGLGHNFGPNERTLDLLVDRVRDVHRRYGQKPILVGWSLGGVMARETAKRAPESVAKVITMGSPFSHTPWSNNIWRPYQAIAGHSVDSPPIDGDLAEKPPLETVALWSPRDGVVSHRAACGQPGERDRAIALRCNHLGFPTAPEAIMTVARELDS